MSQTLFMCFHKVKAACMYHILQQNCFKFIFKIKKREIWHSKMLTYNLRVLIHRLYYYPENCKRDKKKEKAEGRFAKTRGLRSNENDPKSRNLKT